MRILLIHTYYQQPGGEDEVFAAEAALLESRGHTVIPVTLHNRDLAAMPAWRRAAVTIWNNHTYRKLRALIRETHPEVAHIHNTFPLASPAVFHAAAAEGVPVVMTLHNYRLLCPAAIFYRNGRVCEDCLGKTFPWPGVLHGCWRGPTSTAVVAAMLTLHRWMGVWEDKIQTYIALTEFARQKFVEGSFSPNKFVVKPNFVAPDPGVGTHTGGYALFVGRLSAEKGIRTLLRAWERLGGKLPLKIVGDGPLRDMAREAVRQIDGVEWLGRKTPQEVYELMGEAECLVFPSEWYEGFPRVIVESFAKGLPILATSMGSHKELIDNGRTGLLFRPGDHEDLAAQVEWLLSHPKEVAHMRKEARREYEEKYTAEINYNQLMQIYQQAIGK